MSLPEMEPDEIINKYALPDIDTVINSLAVDETTLDKDVAFKQDFHKKGNNPPSYSNVRSVFEVIEDDYDMFVLNLYNRAETQIKHTDVISRFKQQLIATLAKLVVVRNTGRAYLADPDEKDINIK